MNYKINEIKAGVMIFISLAILGIFLVAIFGVEFGVKTKEYRIYLEYVGGIEEGSLVKYRGLDAGQVSEITLPEGDETGIMVKLKVNRKTPVKTDSKAFVTSIGLMSDQHIEISAGSPRAELLPPGSVIESKEVLNFAQMSEAMGELNSQLQVLIGRVSDLLTEENQTHLTSMVGNIDSLVQEGRKPFLMAVSNMEKFSGQLEEMGKNINRLMNDNGGNIDKIVSNLEATTSATNQLISDLHTTVANLESITTSNDQNIAQIVENFQAASQNLEEFSRILKEKPWLLVRKSAPPQRKY